MIKAIFLTLGLAFALTPLSVSAARLAADLTGVVPQVGNTVLVPIVLDTEGVAVNAVEGTLMISSLGTVGDVVGLSTAGSAFTLWPRTPSLSESGDRITFTGGVPRGIEGDGHTVFTLAVRIEQVGSVTIGPADVSVFRHDGEGTRLSASFNSVTITTSPRSSGEAVDAWGALVTNDRRAPGSFEVVVGRDSSVHEGQWFAAFSTEDAESGIAYYEVIEGDRAPVRATGEYVLQNQDSLEHITVRAYDRAGNVRESVWRPSGLWAMNLWLGLLVFAMLLGFGWLRYRGALSL